MTAAQAVSPAAPLTASDMGRSAEALLDLARRKGQAERSVLFGNMTDLLLNESARLSDRERALIGGILQKLISQVEMDIRRGLAERLKSRSDAPAELVALLANDEIEIARPILLESPVLRDPDLMGLIRHRGRYLGESGR